jgi:hypothetical protein
VPRAPSLDVYLFPAVIGGGRGDVEEVRCAGELLRATGASVGILRFPYPRSNAAGDRRPHLAGFPTRTVLHGRSPRALTIASQFGITAEGPRSGPLGAPGPWSREREAVERAYGLDQTLHVSFEEFARTLTSPRQIEERWREGGVPLRVIAQRRQSASFARESSRAHRLYRTFRSFDRANLLPLFPAFGRSRSFAHEFPESVQCGPLWPRRVRSRPRSSAVARRVTWYASPATSVRIAAPLVDALACAVPRTLLSVRSPRPIGLPSSTDVRTISLPPLPGDAWRRRQASADLAIVTGSRSLLEAIVDRVPFLYFNGLVGRGRSARRHRPEKIDQFLAALPDGADERKVRAALLPFARGRSIRASVEGALAPGDAWRRALARFRPTGFAPPFDAADELLRQIARRWATSEEPSERLVRAVRAQSRRPPWAAP